MVEFWSYAQKPAVAPAADPIRQGCRAGRVLRVKDGYNPNSSSVGSAIPVFLVASVAAGGVTVLLLNLLGAAERLLRRRMGGRSPDDP